MIRDAAVQIIKDRLQRGSSTSLDASIVTEMQYVQQYVLEADAFLPWFLINDYSDASFVTVADTETVAVPAGFLREVEAGALWIEAAADDNNIPWKRLQKDMYEALRASTLYEATGKPKTFALLGSSLYLKKTPDAAYLLRWLFFKADTVLSTNIENNWLKYAADWLLNETGTIMAANYIRDPEMTQIFAAQALRARKRVMVDDEARKHANTHYSMGDD